MNSIKKASWGLFPILGLIFLIGCTKMDEYKKYVDGKNTLYPAKVDSLTVFAGHERVVIKSGPITDPAVESVDIYWNNRKDSARVNLETVNGIRRLNASIPLIEGLYYFDLFTYDNFGNRSVPVSAVGVSYGALYQRSLIPRSVEFAEIVNDSLILQWNQAIQASRGVKLTYHELEGQSYTKWVPNDTDTTAITRYRRGLEIEVQTWFLPDSNCVDTFFTPRQILAIDQLLLIGQQRSEDI